MGCAELGPGWRSRGRRSLRDGCVWAAWGLVEALHLADLGLQLPTPAPWFIGFGVLAHGVLGLGVGALWSREGGWAEALGRAVGLGGAVSVLNAVDVGGAAGAAVALLALTLGGGGGAVLGRLLMGPGERVRYWPRGWGREGLRVWAVVAALWGIYSWRSGAWGTGVGGQVGSGSESDRPAVILITVDTLRADAIGGGGARGASTPNLDHLAQSSVWFERAVSTSPFTVPSLTSMLSGLEVGDHGVLANHWPVPDALPLLGDLLASQGVELAVATDLDLADGLGLDRGFRERLHRKLSWAERPLSRALLPGLPGFRDWFDTRDSSLSTTLAVRRWIRWHAPGEEKTLLWVHYYDDAPHAPYRAPRPHAHLPGRGHSLGELESLLSLAALGRPLDADGEAALRAEYAGEVSWLDDQLGVVFDALERGRWLDRAWVIVVADHGEQFGADGVFQHGASLRSDVLRVPLIVRPPGGLPAPMTTSALVSPMDIFPSLLEIFGVEAPGPMSGISLLPLVEINPPWGGADVEPVPEPWASREIVSLTPALGSPRVPGVRGRDRPPGAALIDGRGFKWVVAQGEGAGWAFDLERDPGEQSPELDHGAAWDRLERRSGGPAGRAIWPPLDERNADAPEATDAREAWHGLGYVD